MGAASAATPLQSRLKPLPQNAADNWQPATSNQQPATSNQQPATSNHLLPGFWPMLLNFRHTAVSELRSFFAVIAITRRSDRDAPLQQEMEHALDIVTRHHDLHGRPRSGIDAVWRRRLIGHFDRSA
ncbi:MAG: hypothetical protein H7A19_15985 [Rhodanobacteraceae bacterium]|nr:hypothetical protein [Rhodanobacteraceae bacterium]